MHEQIVFYLSIIRDVYTITRHWYTPKYTNLRLSIS